METCLRSTRGAEVPTTPARPRKATTPSVEDGGQKELPLQHGKHPGPLFGPLSLRKQSKGNLRGKYYRKKQRQATPPWADLDAIRALYKEAKRLTRTTGILHSVDHEIPLKGETVCGLHVENNLRVLPHVQNVAKGNKFMEQGALF